MYFERLVAELFNASGYSDNSPWKLSPFEMRTIKLLLVRESRNHFFILSVTCIYDYLKKTVFETHYEYWIGYITQHLGLSSILRLLILPFFPNHVLHLHDIVAPCNENVSIHNRQIFAIARNQKGIIIFCKWLQSNCYDSVWRIEMPIVSLEPLWTGECKHIGFILLTCNCDFKKVGLIFYLI